MWICRKRLDSRHGKERDNHMRALLDSRSAVCVRVLTPVQSVIGTYTHQITSARTVKAKATAK